MNIYLDDKRMPIMSFKDFTIDFTIVRNFDDFCKMVDENLDKIEFVSFDHDLADYKDGVERTGMDCANYLMDACYDNDTKLPDWFVHSDNTSGRENIIRKMVNYMKVVQGFDATEFNRNHRGFIKEKFI
jgi:hypothetical protein